MSHRLLVLLVAVALAAVVAPVLVGALDVPSTEDVDQIEVTVTTDHGTYDVGETVEVEVAWCNPLDSAVYARLGCPCCGDNLEIRDLDGNPVAELDLGCIQTTSGMLLEAGECEKKTWRWAQTRGLFRGLGLEDEKAVGPGQYTAHFTWTPIDYQTEAAATLRISAVPIPALSTAGLVGLALALLGAATVILRRD